MGKRLLKFVIPVVVIAMAAGCSGYNKLLKTKDPDLMYKAALRYYEDGKFDKTLQLFEQIGPHYMSTVREDTMTFVTADSHYQMRQYEMSAAEFDDFRRRFGRSAFVEEAEYKYAMGFYYMSAPANRDQTATYMAITAINEYLERYPEALSRPLCEVRIEELQKQLYDKSLLNARTYYRTGRYKSAVVALRNALGEFPQTPHREEILYLTVLSGYELASNSVPALRRDRYLDMMDMYYTFVAEFPDSRWRRALDVLQENARDFIAAHPSDVEETSQE